jgi:putative copper resistance protein D
MKPISAHALLTTWQTGPSAVTLYTAVAGWSLVYLMAAARPSPRGRRWPRARTAWFLAGMVLIAVIYGSGLHAYEDNPSVHVVQHMLVMMAVAPMLALAAPITLLLRTLPVGPRRAIVRELQDPAFRPLSGRWAPVLLAADYYLTMYIYQLTPVHTYAEQHALVHFGVHQYFLICGLLFWLPIVGIDPVRLRPSNRVKLLMIAGGIPAFTLLGGVELAQGDTATGWAYIITGAALTIIAAVGTAAREAGRRRVPNPRVRHAHSSMQTV